MTSWKAQLVTLLTVSSVSFASPVAPVAPGAVVVEHAAALKAKYDYIIAGGGTSGLVVANRLTENPESECFRVRLLPLLTNTSYSHRVGDRIWICVCSEPRCTI